jgi:hypothetical protein
VRRTHLQWLFLSFLTLLGTTSLAHTAQALPPVPVVLPLPAPGSFSTVFDFLPNGRIVAFDGFTVYVQESLFSAHLVPIGSLPPEFLGGTDPAFIVASPDGQEVVLGGGAGGSKFPDPNFNGNVFHLPLEGGQATLVGRFPFHIEATILAPHLLVFSEGETFGTLTGSVEMLNLRTSQKITLVGPVPGDPSGVAFDRHGNLYVGLGFGQDKARTGEIHRFDRTAILRAIFTASPLNFDSDGRLVTQILSGGSLHFDRRGHLFVGGGDFIGTTNSFGFFAEVDVDTGQVVALFDPTDGDPNDHDSTFFSLAFTPVGCRLAAVDTFSFSGGTPQVFQRNVCR